MNIANKPLWHFLVAGLALSLMVGCTPSSTKPPAANGEEQLTYQLEIDLLGTKSNALIDSQGKLKTPVELSSADDRITLSLNEGTVSLNREGEPLQAIEVTIDSNPPPPPEDANKVGPVYDLAPQGATFNPPIKLTLTYAPKELPEGLMEEDVYIACYEDGKWEMLRYKQVDTERHNVTTQVDHLAKYGVFVPSSESPPTPDSDHTSPPTNRVEVVYFHRAKRCQKCIWAEEHVRYALETYFKDELDSSKLTFASINVQDASNAAIIKKYDAYTSQLFINAVTGDTERIEHVSEIWQLIGNDEAFCQVVRTKIEKALEGAG